jgi:RNA polymerase sigma factor (sigma-70 family)
MDFRSAGTLLFGLLRRSIPPIQPVEAQREQRRDMTEKPLVNSTSSTFELPLEGAAAGRRDDRPSTDREHGSKNAAPGAASKLERADIEALIAKEYVGLRLLISRQTRDLNIAADLLHEAVCTAWEKWQAGQIDRPEQIAGYIFQVAMNLLRNHRRAIAERPERRADTGALAALPAAAASDEVELRKDLAQRVAKVMRGLSSERDRNVLVRFYLYEQDRDLICRDLQLTAQQFARVLHRARGRLRELLEAQGLKGSDFYSVLLFL